MRRAAGTTPAPPPSIPVLDQAVPGAGGHLQGGQGKQEVSPYPGCGAWRCQRCPSPQQGSSPVPHASTAGSPRRPACTSPPAAHLARLQRVPLASNQHLVVAPHAAHNLQQGRKRGDARRGCVKSRRAGWRSARNAFPPCSPQRCQRALCTRTGCPCAPTAAHLGRLPVPHKQLALAVAAHDEAGVPAERHLARIACTPRHHTQPRSTAQPCSGLGMGSTGARRLPTLPRRSRQPSICAALPARAPAHAAAQHACTGQCLAAGARPLGAGEEHAGTSAHPPPGAP